MHVLIAAVSSALKPTGICRHATNLARSLAGTSEITKITLAVGSWQVEYFRTAFKLNDSKITVLPCKLHYPALNRNLWYLFELPVLAKVIAADVVHLSFPAPLFRCRMPCRVVATIHDLYPYDEPMNFSASKLMFNRWLLRMCLRNTDALTCVSDYTLERLGAIAPPSVMKKAQRIYNCVDFVPSISRAPSVSGLASRPFLLAVAQHRVHKNLHLLLRAFAESRSQQVLPKDCGLVFVGSRGPETRCLQELIEELRLGQNVFLLSIVTDAELDWLYRNALLLVAPSRIEGFCLPVVEALQRRCRVVCSDIPVLREVGESACEYFDLNAPDPVGQLTCHMGLALGKPQPTAPHPERFSARNVAASHIKLYCRILELEPQRRTTALHSWHRRRHAE
jgi:glycosyltransferase involved in cell wall biosynthesis